jgi:hypothetical protein
MNTTIPFTQLESLFQNHRNNPGLPIMTNSFVIEMSQLEKFIMKAKSLDDCDAIKIHLIRYPLTLNKGHIEKTPNADLSQISLAFVPGNIISFVDWTARDVKQGNNIFTLLVCDPESLRSANGTQDKTGVCPPRPCQ